MVYSPPPRLESVAISRCKLQRQPFPFSYFMTTSVRNDDDKRINEKRFTSLASLKRFVVLLA